MLMPDEPGAFVPDWLMKVEAPRKKKTRKPKPPSSPDAPLFGDSFGSTTPSSDGSKTNPEDDQAVPEGHRHKHLLSLAGTLRNRGATKETILAALLAENDARCSPPLPDDEVAFLAEDVVERYDPDPLAGVRVKLPQRESTNGHVPPPPPPEEPQSEVECLTPVPISKLSRTPAEKKWLLEGYIARGRVTMVAALFKAGKTTWLAYLLKAMEKDGRFMGRVVKPCKVLVITEEHEDEWAERRDLLGLSDRIDVLVRPSLYKITVGEWMVFLNKLRATQKRNRYDLIVIDPISNYWPVKDENSAAEVQTALMPLHGVIGEAARLLLHHMRKAEGLEGTQTRGTGAIGGFVDLLVEIRRFDRTDLTDTRRVLTGTGRWRETPAELVISLGKDGYSVHGDKAEARADELAAIILPILPAEPPGATVEELLAQLPEDCELGRSKLHSTLNKDCESKTPRWERTGGGKKGDPYRYYRKAP
jgi:hypothetical protein